MTLVERLRARIDEPADRGLSDEAADAIEKAERREEQLLSELDCHAGFCSHHVKCDGPVAK